MQNDFDQPLLIQTTMRKSVIRAQSLPSCFVQVLEIGQGHLPSLNKNFLSEQPEFLIGLVQQGSGKFRYAVRQYQLSEGLGIWFQDGIAEHNGIFESENLHILWVRFRASFAKEWYDFFENSNALSNTIRFPTGHIVPILFESLLSLFQYDEATRFDDLQANNILLHLMNSFISEAFSKNAYPIQETVSERIALYLNENAHLHITLSTLSAYFKLNQFNLQKLFKKEIGYTPREYLRNIRLKRSCVLLQSTDLAIHIIAIKVGFQNASYYITCFKQAYSVTPQKYRISTQRANKGSKPLS